MAAFKDKTGQKFGRLHVESIADGTYKTVHYNCRCKCGKKRIVRGDRLGTKNNSTRSCGCVGAGRRKLVDLTRKRFGRLVAQWPVGQDIHGSVLWLCVCDCGSISVVRGSALKRQQGCGCVSREHHVVIHGQACSTEHAATAEYVAYMSAKSRCTNPNDKSWKDYGGRGIEFRFTSFEEWFTELGPKPEPKELYSVNRIDNDGHYEPGNVEWATFEQQANNRRNPWITRRAQQAASLLAA